MLVCQFELALKNSTATQMNWSKSEVSSSDLGIKEFIFHWFMIRLKLLQDTFLSNVVPLLSNGIQIYYNTFTFQCFSFKLYQDTANKPWFPTNYWPTNCTQIFKLPWSKRKTQLNGFLSEVHFCHESAMPNAR